jgi:DNA processing protein
VADLEYVMNWQASQNKKEIQRPLFTELDQEEKKLVSILREFPVSGIDLLASKTGLSVGKTSALLLGLEFKNVVVQQPGKCFTLNHAYQASL